MELVFGKVRHHSPRIGRERKVTPKILLAEVGDVFENSLRLPLQLQDYTEKEQTKGDPSKRVPFIY
jgi:hypothetical protein